MGEFENFFGILQRPLTYMHCNVKLHTRINPFQCNVIVLNMLIETVKSLNSISRQVSDVSFSTLLENTPTVLSVKIQKHTEKRRK